MKYTMDKPKHQENDTQEGKTIQSCQKVPNRRSLEKVQTI
jgi:hypothetical protein